MESTDPNHGRIGTHVGGFARKSHRDSHKKIALALNAESHYKTARMSDRSEGSRLKVTSVGTGTQQGFIPANLSSSNRWKRTDLKRTWIKLSTFDSGQEMANTALKTRLTSTLLVISAVGQQCRRDRDGRLQLPGKPRKWLLLLFPVRQ